MSRRGFVLWVVLASLLLASAVLAAVIFEALLETRGVRGVEAALRARAAAGSALALAQSNAAGLAVASLAVGDSARFVSGTLEGAAFQARAAALGEDRYAVRAVGSDLASGIERELLTVLRILPLVPPRAALRLRAPPPPGSEPIANGLDRSIPGWPCPPPEGAATAISVDSGASDSAFLALGPLPWPALRAWALAAGTADSLTIAFHAGDTSLAGTRFTGILVVDGTLRLEGGAQVVGIVVARGGLVFGPGGGVVTGAALTDRISIMAGAEPPVSLVQFSSCAVGLAGRANARLSPLPGLPPQDSY